ncbi:Putative glycoside hydrolase family 18, catalytic domain, glycosyl hydrolase family 18 (GH18) active [Septoria linicola]|uniref:chitinase n=1 Tax=Septoria linicola TaxID=215465 RepID=A0A9Q9ED27_9PEZI|nr:putative glycoside hydrolase family 18, catalytic domain, glycosyl hydrolase family 18 (GH18) active [Septoria linicola]USW47326.1 Putative glycoside hydrolase family 18, catalytic domain, glycosyl hydrolase family 18 (GH18) active [Septoria linicola]
MPSLLPLGQGPRVIVYHQTHHGPDGGPPVSLLPLITNNTGVTHVIIAAIHVNDKPEDLTLNDTAPSHEKFNTLWGEVAWLQASGIKVLGMLGGFAKGSFERLDGDDVQRFEAFYVPLRDMIRQHRLDGLDLDIEEPTSLPGTCRLIDRLRADFGPQFLITLAPVATALLPNQPHLSGPAFDYRLLEQMRGHEIAWYNTQFYCGWGDAGTTAWYDAIMSVGWPANKVVMGLMSNPANGPGHVEWPRQEPVLRSLRNKYPAFGGVMCWEYFNALPGGHEKPWEWAANMARVLRTPIATPMPIRPFGMPAQLTRPAHNFPAESISTLKDLGFSEQQAIAALNSTNGNVEYAAGLLFQD